MKKIKIVMTRSMLPKDQNYVKDGLEKRVGDVFELVEPDGYDEESICKVISDADIILGSYVSKNILKQAEKLQLIQVPWTGMDNFDFEAVKHSNIPVCNTHSNADAVAELGMAIILDLLKKISYHDRKMRSGDWNRKEQPLDLKSRMVAGLRVCILGCGNIGYRLAKLLHGFGAVVSAVGGEEKQGGVINRIYEKNQLREAFSHADLLVITVPLTEDTRKMINEETLSYAEDGILLVNLSRGEIIDEDAVYKGLISGKIGGFGADVWWNAPSRGESKAYPSKYQELCTWDHVVLSPHRAGFVAGGLPHLDGAILNLANFIEGKPLVHVVNVMKQY